MEPIINDYAKEVLTSTEEENIPTPAEELKAPPSGGWGDAEHCTLCHSALKPHTCPPEYDAKHHHYREPG